MLLWRILKALVLVLIGWLAVTGVPFVARYLRLRQM